jgi:hypothetical protein
MTFFVLGSLGLIGLLALIAFFIIGIFVIIFVAKVIFFVLPAAIIALIVWLLTGGNELLAGIAFLVVAVLSVTRR